MNDVVDGANDAFSFTVLGGGVGAGHAQVDAMGQEEHAGAEIIELATIVALNALDGGAKLCADIGKEIGERRVSVRLELLGKRPQVMGIIIQNSQIILVTRDTDNGRSPEITMY